MLKQTKETKTGKTQKCTFMAKPTVSCKTQLKCLVTFSSTATADMQYQNDCIINHNYHMMSQPS